jgi:hypothetical protein
MRPNRCARLDFTGGEQVLHHLIQNRFVSAVVSCLSFLTLDDYSGIDEDPGVMAKQREADLNPVRDVGPRSLLTIGKFANESYPHRVGKRRKDPGLPLTGCDLVHTHSVTPIEGLVQTVV